jgi:hypothetical protein
MFLGKFALLAEFQTFEECLLRETYRRDTKKYQNTQPQAHTQSECVCEREMRERKTQTEI